MLPTGSDMRLCEERVPTRCNHEEHDETNQWKRRPSKDRVKVSLLMRLESNVIFSCTETNTIAFHNGPTVGRHQARRMSLQMYTIV